MVGVFNIGLGPGRTSTGSGDLTSLGAAYWLGAVVKYPFLRRKKSYLNWRIWWWNWKHCWTLDLFHCLWKDDFRLCLVGVIKKQMKNCCFCQFFCDLESILQESHDWVKIKLIDCWEIQKTLWMGACWIAADFIAQINSLLEWMYYCNITSTQYDSYIWCVMSCSFYTLHKPACQMNYNFL